MNTRPKTNKFEVVSSQQLLIFAVLILIFTTYKVSCGKNIMSLSTVYQHSLPTK